jgi:hypothetical protein
MLEDEIWDRVSEDGNRKEDYRPQIVKGVLWLGIYAKDNTLIGIFVFNQLTLTIIKFHACIIKKYRQEYAKEAGRLGIIYFSYHLDDRVKKAVLEIPVCYPEVCMYSLRNGFVKEGINRKSVMKKGKLIDQYLLGITKEEAISSLKKGGKNERS